MPIRSSKQVSRWHSPERLPVSRDPGARHDPGAGRNSSVDTDAIDCERFGPKPLNARIKNKVGAAPTSRRLCRESARVSCAMKLDGSNWLTCFRSLDEIGLHLAFR